ncbi:MAG: hypothetical protein L3J56_02625 [Bacteroidales bacterium]|nr:hypothetical protein [Bacteroidales bacterium]
MKNTPDGIYKIQHEIFMKKSPEERILFCNPEIPQNELKVKIFEEFYSDVFIEKELKKITDKLYKF